MSNQRTNRIKEISSRRLLSGVLAVVFVLSAVVFLMSTELFSLVAQADPLAPSSTVGGVDHYDINDSATLLQYASEYAAGQHKPDDYLNITTASILDLTTGGFDGIGTSGRPFAGTIYIPSAMNNIFIANKPLFNYISTDAQIVDENGAVRQLIVKRRAYDGTDQPIFAANVTQGTTDNAQWSVKLQANEVGEDNPKAYPVAGVIGTVAANAHVTMTFVHDSNGLYVGLTAQPAKLLATGNLGMVCNTLGAGAVLTANVSSAYTFDVESTSGHVGGIVGEMQDGSKLILGGDFESLSNVTASGSGKYAGGLVGHATNAEIDYNGHTATVSKTVTGTAGAGGMFGYYSSTTANGTGAEAGNRVFDLSGFRSDADMIIEGSGNSGGVIGELEATNSLIVRAGETFSAGDDDKTTFNRYVKLNSGSSRGGVIGLYKNTLLSNTLEMKELRISASSDEDATAEIHIAGAIGSVAPGSAGNYVHIHDVAVKNSGGKVFSAALVGDMGTKGSFLDVDGKIAAMGNYYAGLVRYQRAGVVRIAGYTDFGGGYFGTAANMSTGNDTYGQLVGVRGNGLVYSTGTGSDTLTNEVSSGWTFRRSGKKLDDIGDWGEVLRPRAETDALLIADVLTYTPAAHTVTVAAPETSMGSITDFVKTALNIQHNVSGQPAGGALIFDDTTNTSTALLGTDLEFTDDIDLSNTGIVALTRDNGGNAAFTKELDGNSHTVTLAIGEAYGLNESGGAVTEGDNGYGTICRHRYQGLFAETDGASVKDLTVAGTNYTRAESNDTYIGGIVACATNSLALSGVTTQQTDYVYGGGSTRCGGAVGYIANGAAGTVSVSGSSVFKTTINDERTSNGSKIFGGAIGYVRSTGALTFNISSVTLDGSYNKTNAQDGSITYGGLIGAFYPASTNAGANNRKVNITGLTVGEHAKIDIQNKATNDRSSGSGAFVGGSWPNVDVTIGTAGSTNGITVGGTSDASSKPTISVRSGSTNANIGALFYKATGLMDVNYVNVVEADIQSAVNGTFGFIVNDACYDATVDNTAFKSALYLDVDKANYTIGNTTLSAGKFDTAFDEIAAYSKFGTTDLAANGQAIISISLPSNALINMESSGDCNTYQNQTSYATKINANTRYYYNLKSIRAKSALSDAEALLMWSVYTYGHSSLRSASCLKDEYNIRTIGTINGNCDMKGLSYYPVDASGMTIASGTTVKFYNHEIEDRESSEGSDGDSSVRSTRKNVNESQHRLMHEGIFRNYSGTLTVNGLTVQGSVSNQNNGYSGFLICGTLKNDVTAYTANVNNIVLDGAYVDGRSSGDYAPLLINKIGKNVSLNMTGVRTTGYPSSGTTAVASSLIGDVGKLDGTTYETNIRLNFSDIRLDARTTAGSPATLTTYGTDRSIFDRASLLNKFLYDQNCSGVYNYNYAEDWSGSTGLHHVTYGSEITKTGSEYEGLEINYYDYYQKDNHYTNPESSAAARYSSFAGFLPYVYTAYNTADNTHELRVNIQELPLMRGCGQYNDPYIIDDGGQLVTVAKIIHGEPAEGIIVVLPDNLGGGTNPMWHDSDETHHEYVYVGGSTKKFVYGSTEKTRDAVREYLAGAYYLVEKNIALPAAYSGLGATSWSDTTEFRCNYAFRGVIVGKDIREEGASTAVYPTITNTSPSPLIKTSNGCVVKNVNVEVGSAVTLNRTSAGTNFRYDDNGMLCYGIVIGQVMAGDTVIDNVGVSFASGVSITLTGSNNYHRLVPVGGYVGVVVNGGVIFRNMSSGAGISGNDVKVGSSGVISNAGWLYVNPIIGRVLSGYAFEEGAAYAAESENISNSYATDSSTGKKLYKNYGICTLVVPSSDSGKLGVTASAANAHSVTVPDAQALYILSCIVNSGAGSAEYNASTEKDYADLHTTPWVAYREYAQTRCAAYSDVATDLTSAASTCSDYNTKVKTQDVYSGRNKIPYIIRQYTTQDTLYRARSITHSSSLVSLIELGSGFNSSAANSDLRDGLVSAGFRGIGSIYYKNSVLTFGLKEFDGNGKTVKLNMTLWMYTPNSSFENYLPYYESLNKTTIGAGFGLFTRFFNSADGTDVENDNSKIVNIHDCTVTGSVLYDVLNKSGERITYYWNADQNGANHSSILSVGAVAGCIGCPFVMEDISIDGVRVEGVRYVGGMIGETADIYYKRDKQRKIVNCGAGSSGITVISGATAGGLVGYAHSSWLVIEGASGKTTLKVNEISIKCTNITTSDNDFVSAGGLLGHADCGRNKGMSAGEAQDFDVKDYKIVGTSDEAFIGSDKTDKFATNKWLFAGGVCGTILNSVASIENVETEIDVKAIMAGGICGRIHHNGAQKGRPSIFVSLKAIVCKDCMVTGYRYAGGVAAYVKRSNGDSGYTEGVDIDGCTLQNVDIEQTATAKTTNSNDGTGAAGCVAATYSSNQVLSVYVRNMTVSQCEIKSNYDKDSSASGTGGLVGVQYDSSDKYTRVYGYNILLDRLTLEHDKLVDSVPTVDNDRKDTSYLVGNNIGNNSYIKLVGVTIYQCNTSSPLTRLTGNSSNTSAQYTAHEENFGVKSSVPGYVVLADFGGKSVTDPNASLSSLAGHSSMLTVGGTTKTEVSAASPYVTVNPDLDIADGTFFLTGDGMSATVNGLAIKSGILGSLLYNYARTYVPSGWAAGETCQSVFESYQSKLSTYNEEQANALEEDFAVLVVDDTNEVAVTKMIVSYINLLANTRFNYAVDDANVYRVVVKRMDTTGGGCAVSSSAPNLNRDTTEQTYDMNANNVDTAGDMFTLIDVQFYDPTDTTKIAYHLYVPVLVKKMLKFDFQIATLAGTDYDHTSYDDRFGKSILENLGAPVTLYFGYSYKRTYADWQTALDDGENLLYSYAKTLNFTKTGGSVSLNAHYSAADAPILVLIDRSRGGKPYYATFGSDLSSLALSSFRESLSDSSSAAFSPLTFSELLDITATANASSGKYVTCAEANATVKVGETYYKLYQSGDSGSRADLTVNVPSGKLPTDILPMEDYYLSIFTKPSTSTAISAYTVSAPSSFGDSAHPSRIEDASVLTLDGEHGNANLYMGNIFVQGDVSVAAQPADEEITEDNNELTVSLGASVKIVESMFSTVSGLLSDTSGINVYQSFLVDLNVHSGDDYQKLVANPDVSGRYVIGSDPSATVGDSSPSYGADDIRKNSNYIELVSPSLNSIIRTAGGATAYIKASVDLTYDGDKIAEQFPKRPDGTNDGAQVCARSNVGYDRDTTAYSTASTDEKSDSNNRWYYSKLETSHATLSYNVVEDDFGGDYGLLGINPLDTNGMTQILVSTVASLDINKIMSEAEGFDYVRCTLKLSGKTNYAAYLVLSDYWTSATIPGADFTEEHCSAVTTTGTDSYTFTVQRSWAESNSGVNTMLQVPIDFTVITGSEFESGNTRIYSNYKVTLTMELVKADGTVCDPSSCTDFIIYTNARILPDFILEGGE